MNRATQTSFHQALHPADSHPVPRVPHTLCPRKTAWPPRLFHPLLTNPHVPSRSCPVITQSLALWKPWARVSCKRAQGPSK